MKKLLALALVLVFAVALISGCSTSTTTTSASPSKAPSASASAAPSAAPSASASASAAASASAPAAQKLKTGLAVTNSIAKSTSAGDKDGLAEADSVLVGVLVDSTGKIVDCAIDMVQAKINFDKTGKLTTKLDTTFKTKNELGKDYGLSKASSIGKEWNEQTAVLAKYVIGKTAEQVKGIAVDKDGKATGSDLKASVTVSINAYIDTIAKAVANAQDMGAKTGDKLGISAVTNMASSKDISDKDGLAQAYSNYIALTKDAAGKITSCIIDASQSNVNFDKTGKITTDLTKAPQTKNELKEAYGMKKASSIGKEWYEQAAAFAKYVTGKTVADIKGIAVDKDGKATATDIKATVTVHITDFQTMVEKAAK